MSTKTEIKWQEYTVNEVMLYFAQGFKLEKGKKILSVDYMMDPHKEKVAFKLFIEKGQ